MTMNDTSAEADASAIDSRQLVEICLADTNASYQKLLADPGRIEQCREAGITVRRLAQCLIDADGLQFDDDIEEELDD